MGAAGFDISAIFVCLTCLVYMGVKHRWDKLQSKLFIIAVIDLIITAASNFAAELIRVNAVASASSLAAINAAGYLYFVTHTALAPLFLLYVMAISRVTMHKDRVRIVAMGSLFYLAELLVLTAPLTGWVYSYGPDLAFIRNWGVYVLFIVGILYFIMSIVQLIRSWQALTPDKRNGLTFFFALALLGVFVQMVVQQLRIELFAEALAVLGMLMFVENEEELIDSGSHVYNRRALEMDLNMYSNTGRAYYAIAVRVTNADTFTRIGGSLQAARQLTGSVIDFFETLVPWYHIYRTSPTRYIIVDPQKSREEALEQAKVIAERFKGPWKYRDVDIDLQAVVVLACVPDDLHTASDVFYLVDTPVSPIAGKDVLEGADLNYLVRRAEVERAVRRGFEEGNYEVYYQPIYDADGKARVAEALMRLNDSVLGSVPPYEFIEVAERMGMIEDIGEFALKEVCAFLSSGVPKQLGIDHISVNLSVIQCMQADFAMQADAVIASYGIDPQLVSFEITESIAAGDYDFLARVMRQLNRTGHRFAMDDFGTGYSNMHSFIRLNFDVVKIDKTVLWDAEKSDMGMIILENSVGMLRNVGCSVLVEGVETAKQVEVLQRLGIDFYQGFFFAEPMPKDELVAFLQ